MFTIIIFSLLGFTQSNIDKEMYEVLEEINQYNIELKLRKEYKNAKGCPIEPNYYWNIDCA